MATIPSLSFTPSVTLTTPSSTLQGLVASTFQIVPTISIKSLAVSPSITSGVIASATFIKTDGVPVAGGGAPTQTWYMS